MAKAPAVITLTPEQRALIRQASGKEVAELAVDRVAAADGLLLSTSGETRWLLKPVDPASQPDRRPRRPRIAPRFARFRLKIGRSRIHRWGVFAAEPIPAQQDVIEYVGEIVDPEECFRRLRNAGETYAIELDQLRAIDGAVGGSGAEVINHSCSPNLRYRIADGRVFCQSLRSIEPAEELTADYRFRSEGPRVECRCGSPRCRGTINAARARG